MADALQQLRAALARQVQARWMVWKMQGAARPIGAYGYIDDYVLDRGVVPTSAPLTDPELQALQGAADLVGDAFEVQQCFANAGRLIMHDTAKVLTYHEGYAMRAGLGIPVLHAWVQINGKVIDLTWRRADDDPPGDLPADHPFADRIVGTIPGTCAYLSIQIETPYLMHWIGRTGTWGSVLDDWKEGFPLICDQPRLTPVGALP